MTNRREPRERPGRPTNRNHITPHHQPHDGHQPMPLDNRPSIWATIRSRGSPAPGDRFATPIVGSRVSRTTTTATRTSSTRRPADERSAMDPTVPIAVPRSCIPRIGGLWLAQAGDLRGDETRSLAAGGRERRVCRPKLSAFVMAGLRSDSAWAETPLRAQGPRAGPCARHRRSRSRVYGALMRVSGPLRAAHTRFWGGRNPIGPALPDRRHESGWRWPGGG
jgi:hypothetical protein